MNGIESLGGLTDEDFKQTIVRALRLLAVIAAIGMAFCWWKAGWKSAALLLVGAGISGSGLWEWMRLMVAVMERMDEGAVGRPMAGVLVGFFVRLGLTVVVLYVSLKYLNGSVYALAAGLGLVVFGLAIEGIRLVRAGTV